MQYRTTADPPLIDDAQIADLFAPPRGQDDEELGWLGADPNLLSIDDIASPEDPYPEIVPSPT